MVGLCLELPSLPFGDVTQLCLVANGHRGLLGHLSTYLGIPGRHMAFSRVICCSPASGHGRHLPLLQHFPCFCRPGWCNTVPITVRICQFLSRDRLTLSTFVKQIAQRLLAMQPFLYCVIGLFILHIFAPSVFKCQKCIYCFLVAVFDCQFVCFFKANLSILQPCFFFQTSL